MRGVSRTSFVELRDQLSEALASSGRPASRAASGRAASGRAGSARAASTGAAALGEDLFAVLRLLDREHALRRALSDPSKPADEKGAVAAALFHGKVTPPAEDLIVAAVRSRWASPADMTDAIEQVAIEAFVIAAEADGQLDDLEDELFRFGRVVAAQPELRAALSEVTVPEEGKRELLGALLDGKVTPVALRLITEMSLHPRGRSLPASLELCTRIAARRRERLIAVVRVASELSSAQRRRLAEALAANFGHDVYVNMIIDPAVMGGMTIQIDDELIDASVASRLAAVRRRLAG
jgi:F-type H+-transporting ATPase subunit delta